MKKVLFPLLVLLLLGLRCVAAAQSLTLSFVGDCTVGEQWCYRGYRSGYTYKIGQSGLDYPFSLCADLFAADDLTVANCEGVFTTRLPADRKKAMSLCADPRFAEVFKLGNVDVVNITNNHALDFGRQGRLDTIDALTAQGIGYFGESWLYETEIKGIKIGIVGHTFHLSEYVLEEYRQQIETLKADGCSFIIASVHWGREDSHELNSEQKAYGTRLIDLGANMVFGHGSHTLEPIQYYDGGLILYSTGNFTFGANGKPKDMDTAVIQVMVDSYSDGTVRISALKAYPYCVCYKADFRPYPYTEEADRLRVWRKLVFSAKNEPDSCLPASFLTTGYADFGTYYDIATDSDLATPTEIAPSGDSHD